jgi:hypothetical protein
MNQLIRIVLITIGLFGTTVVGSAQWDASSNQNNVRRSIWDKEPEPTTTTPAPFGTNATAAGSLQVQENGTLNNPPAFPDYTQDGVPIDGGLSFLMAAGALYGARRIKKHRKRRQTKEEL